MGRSLQSLHGVFLGSHAVAEGMVSAKQLKSGLYRRLLHNVYADPGLPAVHELYARAAMLVMPAHAALGGRSAAAWYGAPFASAADPVLVLVPPDAPWRGPKGVHVHRGPLPSEDVVRAEDGALRLTTSLRTAWEVAALEPLLDAVATLDAMVRTQHLDLEALRRLHAASQGRWRTNRVGKVLPYVDGRSQSPPESWVRVSCVRGGLPVPVPQYVVIEDGEFLGKVDLAWPEQRLIVEYEGPHHFDERQIRLDGQRYARLAAAGWRVVRLSSADLRDLDAVVDRIWRALGEPAFTR